MTFPPVSCCENLHSRPQEKYQALFGSSSTAQRGDDEQCIHSITLFEVLEQTYEMVLKIQNSRTGKKMESTTNV